MDRFFHDDFKYKVNMGNKKDLDKKNLMAQHHEEKEKRRIQKLQTESATLIQKLLRSAMTKERLAKQILISDKAAAQVSSLEMAITQKMPQHRLVLTDKALQKLIGPLTIALNNSRNNLLIKSLDGPLSDLVNLVVQAPTIGAVSQLIQKDQYELFISVLLKFCIRVQKSNLSQNLFNLTKDFMRNLLSNEIKVNNLQQICTQTLQIENFLPQLKQLTEMKLQQQQYYDQGVLGQLQSVVLSSDWQSVKPEYFEVLIMDLDIIKLFSNQEQKRHFLEGILLPWFRMNEFRVETNEVYQYSTLLEFMIDQQQSQDIKANLDIVKLVAQRLLTIIQKVQKTTESAVQGKVVILNSRLIQNLPKATFMKKFENIIDKQVLYYFKDGIDSFPEINQSSSIISLVLQIMKAMNIQSQFIERQLIFRSNILVNLYKYLEDSYSAVMNEKDLLLEMVRTDQDLFKLFFIILNKRLTVLDDFEFQGTKSSQSQKPFLTLDQSRFTSELLNRIAYRIFQSEGIMNYFSEQFKDELKNSISRLYDRDRRLKLYPKDFWIVDKNLLGLAERINLNDIKNYVSPSILKHCQQTIPFQIRAILFRQWIQVEKETRQNNMFSILHSEGVEIRREYMLEDAFDKLFNLGEDIKNRLRIQFVDLNYITEEGVDGGGLFKEFMTKLTEIIFDPQYAFFTETQDRKLYPNYLSSNLFNFQNLFKFFGMVVGKAIFEGILLKCTFARFFLNKLVSKGNSVDDLQSLDPEIYNNLMYLKYYQGNAEDLGLSFSISEDQFGKKLQIPLVPNGEHIEVTNENKLEYIMLYANYVLNFKIQTQTQAFVEGLHTVISQEQLDLFYSDEVQLLISGGKNEVDIDDLRRNTTYHGFKESDPYIQEFWNYLKSCSNEEKEKFLVFVTGTNRPPLLGFKYLNPQFCIHQIILDRGEQRLPTSSTCMNMLKLPHYGHPDRLREFLHIAINSNAGFNLE